MPRARSYLPFIPEPLHFRQPAPCTSLALALLKHPSQFVGKRPQSLEVKTLRGPVQNCIALEHLLADEENRMTTDFIRPMYLARSQLAEYERLAWFLFEWFERERRLNLEALSATPPFAAMTLMRAMQPCLFFRTSLLVISAAKE